MVRMSAHFIKKAGMKKDNKLPYISYCKKSVTIIVEGKKPLAQQSNQS